MKPFKITGHTDIITQINWTIDDRKLISIGSEGAIYEWDINTGIRVNEVVLKGITLSGVVLSSDGVTSYCVSTDGKIHEVKENTVKLPNSLQKFKFFTYFCFTGNSYILNANFESR